MSRAELQNGPFRDDPEVRWDDDLQAVRLMTLAEGDVVWAVERKSLEADDPPVVIFDFPEGPGVAPGTWTGPRPGSSSIRGFAFLASFTYLRGSRGGFWLFLPDREREPSLEGMATTRTRVGEIDVIEGPDLLAWIGPVGNPISKSKWLFRLELGPRWRGQVPTHLLDLAASSPWRGHGCFQ